MDVSISAVRLHQSLDGFPPPLIIDVGREAASPACDRMLAGSIRRDPDQLEEWAADLDIGRPITVYGGQGRGASQDVARFLVGGLDSWVDQGLPVQPRPAAPPTKLVTRCSIWNRRTSSAVAVSGERPRNVAKRPTSRM
jgi:hypothetical protein